MTRLKALVGGLVCLTTLNAVAGPPNASLRYRADLTREAQFIFGINAPIPALAAQIEQESGWNAGITAFDNGRGLAQFMDPSARWIADQYQLGKPDPYNPIWAIRAQARLNYYNLSHVRGDNDCEKWGAALKAYNAGLGYVLKAQVKSKQPGLWFGVTEWVPTGQNPKNFQYSRFYPHWILGKRQRNYLDWGQVLCEGRLWPLDTNT